MVGGERAYHSLTLLITTTMTDNAPVIELSKNLLLLNFMKRTPLAKERLEKAAKKEGTSPDDFQFPLPASIIGMLKCKIDKAAKL